MEQVKEKNWSHKKIWGFNADIKWNSDLAYIEGWTADAREKINTIGGSTITGGTMDVNGCDYWCTMDLVCLPDNVRQAD